MPIPSQRPQIQIRMDPDLIARMDQVCDKWVIGRAKLIEFAVEHLLANNLIAERDLCDRLATELARHGWGDFHYGEQPQDAAIVALLDEYWDMRGRRRVDHLSGPERS